MAILQPNNPTTPTRSEPAPDQTVAACQQCQRLCLGTVIGHGLPQGGRHVAPEHVRLLLDCAEICQTTANFLLRGTALYTQIGELCAVICEQTARDCDRFSDEPQLRDCAEACRRCASACRQISGMRQAA